jgi:hypothetical protein
MATGFTINAIDYANVPAGSQTWTFEYKLWNATSYTLISNSASVNTDGTLGVPLPVSGLTAGQLYYIQAYPNCSSPFETFLQMVQL